MFTKTTEYQLEQWLTMTYSCGNKGSEENNLHWPVAQFPNSICRNVKWRAVLLFTQKWPQTIGTKKRHNKSYFELNRGSDRGPGCHTEGPWGQTQSDTQPQSCWITFPAWCSARMTYNNPGSTQERGYYRTFHCTGNKMIRFCSGSLLFPLHELLLKCRNEIKSRNW